MKQTTELPVKRIAEFDCSENDPKLLRRPRFWLGLMGFSALLFTALLVATATSGLGNLVWIAVALFVAVCFCGTRIIDLADDAKKERGKAFDHYLATISPDLLKVVAASPEYDKGTKDAVIKHLSDAHPGWSLT